MNKKIIIWGASGHALVVADILRLVGEYHIVGLLDDVNPQPHKSNVLGLTVLGGLEQLDEARRSGTTHLIFGFGDCGARLRLASLVRKKGLQFATAIHPSAVVASDVPVGLGTVIAAGAVVNPGSRIGENVIINTSASVDHECVIGNGVHLSPGVRLGGLVTVEEGAWIGIGATIRDRIHIGAHSNVGAGAVILQDIPAGVLAYGVPGKVIRNLEERKSGEGVANE